MEHNLKVATEALGIFNEPFVESSVKKRNEIDKGKEDDRGKKKESYWRKEEGRVDG